MADKSVTSTEAPAASTPAKTSARETEYKVVQKNDDNTVILELQDDSGRMIPAEVPEGIEVRKGSLVTITSDGEDESGAPLNAKVAKAK
ncbi:MAG: hypothetical protein ACTHJR_18100 [Sphingomonas sp.]|uniref:hypothetical protein n=1 Tax=Sphingomonas sp. TaxID=28214 RepID=UPI003F80CADC